MNSYTGVNSHTGSIVVLAMPDPIAASEYLRDLIHHDMDAQSVVTHVMGGLDDLSSGRFSDKSILDIAEED